MKDYKNHKEPEVITLGDGLGAALFVILTLGGWILINTDYLDFLL